MRSGTSRTVAWLVGAMVYGFAGGVVGYVVLMVRWRLSDETQTSALGAALVIFAFYAVLIALGVAIVGLVVVGLQVLVGSAVQTAGRTMFAFVLTAVGAITCVAIAYLTMAVASEVFTTLDYENLDGRGIPQESEIAYDGLWVPVLAFAVPVSFLTSVVVRRVSFRRTTTASSVARSG